MKSILITLLIVVSASAAVAQETLQTVTNNGSSTTNNLTIGYSLRLQANSTIKSAFAYDNNIQQMYLYGYDPNSFFSIYTAGNRRFDITARGDVAIGTSSVDNIQGWNRVLQLHGTSHAKLLVTEDTGVKVGMFAHTGGLGKIGTESHHNLTFTAGYWNDVMTLTTSGDVGIGTITPKEKLSVNGKIRAHEVKVETANWPDYVFEEGYQIGKLAELESYIKANKHLPEVPSAKEVEANGVELGEMNKILLKKIEELTLHLIDKEKEIQQERNINKKQEERLTILEKFITNLKDQK